MKDPTSAEAGPARSCLPVFLRAVEGGATLLARLAAHWPEAGLILALVTGAAVGAGLALVGV